MSSFNIRVYGVLRNDQNEILLSDEIIGGKYYTKFPGGGLEYGEGTLDCLQREFKEETGLDVTIGDHIYTTDFFQPSAFHKGQQIISIYYWVHCADTSKLVTSKSSNDFSRQQIEAGIDCEVFRWIAIDQLREGDVSLPIDKIVVGKLLEKGINFNDIFSK